MTTPPKTSIADLPLHDLLSGLEDRNFRREGIIELWMKSAGYYPGTTPIKAAEFYQIFADWYRVRPELATYPLPTNQQFGIEMATRFKRERRRNGNYYFISRESVPYIPPSLGTGGGGNPGGGTPGASKRKRNRKD